MKRLLKDPLLHFLLIGAALSLVFGLIEGPAENPENRIVITQGDIESLKANFTRTWKRLPTEDELSRLIEDQVRDEISFREAVAMGLDQNDRVIRKRLRMKMELLAEDLVGLAPPTEEDLNSYLAKHRDSFRREAQVSFKQIYLNSDKRGDDVENDARDIERLFEKSFSQDVLQIEPGDWTGPVRSSYGLHLIFVHERIAARDPDLAEIRQAVEREWTAKRRKEVKKKYTRSSWNSIP
jgi:hypothetical protein